MMELNERLRERRDRPVKVSLVGAGQMGSEIIAQVGEMVGMQIAAVVDVTLQRAAAGYGAARRAVKVVETNSIKDAEHALQNEAVVATTDYRIATSLSEVEAVIDATGSTEMAAQVALSAINNKKHIIMMSVECDITIGPILRQMADNAGVVYSLAAGDEPAAIIELYRFADALGFDVITAGKGKNNPLNIYATPETERQKAKERQMNPRMLSEFVDGSKTAIEMTAVSNASGLVPDVRGMHGPKASVETLSSVFVPKEFGGVLDGTGVVDYAIGVHPGVFVVIHTDNQKIMHGMHDRDMGAGPYYILYRPYHLCSVEVPITVGSAVFYGESTGHPYARLTSECFAVSKRDLSRGEVLDDIGEFCYRASIERAEIARDAGLLPLGIAKGCRLVADIPKDTPITYDDVEVEYSSTLLDLRRIQDRLFASEAEVHEPAGADGR